MPAISRAKWPLLALCAGLCAGAAFAFPFSVDDAYITARYAQRLARGLGYTFNDGPATDGVTGPLWLVPLVAAAKAGLDPLLAAKLLGLACVALAAGLCVLRARGRAEGASLAWGTAALITTSLSLLVWGIAGLETGAATLASTGMGLSVTARRGPRPVALGLCIACAAWLRPELSFAAFACLVCAALRDRSAALRALAFGVASALSLFTFRRLMFGAWLPLSAAAKPAELGHGLRYALDAATSLDVAPALLFGAFMLRAARRVDRMHAAIIAAHVLGCVLAGGDWMPGLRLFAPIVPLSALTLAAGARDLPSTGVSRGAVVLSVLTLLGLVHVARELPAVRAAGENRSQQVPELARHLSVRAGAVMALDIGALGAFTGRTMLDLGGLVEPRVAHARGGHLDKKIDERWVSESEPAWIVLHSAARPVVSADARLLSLAGYPVEQRVARMPYVRTHYRVHAVQRYADAYFYVILRFVAPRRGSHFGP